jgi:hypothetical protein
VSADAGRFATLRRGPGTARPAAAAPAAGLLISGPSGHTPSALRTRFSETGYAVPSCCANKLTRSSSSIHRA